MYTQILTLLGLEASWPHARIFLPVSTLFVPFFGLLMRKKGFGVTFFVVLLLGITWNSVMLVPNLPLQVVGFAAFTNFRGLLFAAFFTFLGHSFGSLALKETLSKAEAIGPLVGSTPSSGALQEACRS